MWLTSTAGMLASYIIITGLSVSFYLDKALQARTDTTSQGSFAQNSSRALGISIVPMLFVYYGFYDVGWTPLPFSYGAEILPYHMRLKGLSILLSVQSIAQAFVSISLACMGHVHGY